MRFDRPLDDLFASRSHVRVLRALAGSPRGLAVSGRDVGRRAGISHPRAAEVLSELTAQGVVRMDRRPGAHAYQLEEQHVLTDRVRGLFEWEAELYDELLSVLRSEVLGANVGVREAYLFGSVARGEATPRSDIDLAVVAPAREPDDVVARLSAVEELVRRRFGNELSVLARSGPLERRARGRRVARSAWDRIAAEGRRLIPADAGRRRA